MCDTSKLEALPVPKKHGDDSVDVYPLVTDVQMRGGQYLQGIRLKW